MCFRVSYPRGPLSLYVPTNRLSNAVYVFYNKHTAVCNVTGTSVLSFVDLCGVRQCELFLCDYVSVESRGDHSGLGCVVCGVEGRVGGRQAGDEGEGCSADLVMEGRFGLFKGVWDLQGYCGLYNILVWIKR